MLANVDHPRFRDFRGLSFNWTSHTNWLPLTLTLWAGLACSACSSDNETAQGSSPIGDYGIPIAGCEQYSTSACDITLPSCQSNIFNLVKCVRKTPAGTLPPVETITTTQYQDSLTQSSSDLNPDDLKRHEAALVMLGLASPGDLTVSNQVDVLVTTVSAYYSSDDKKVTIVRPDTPPTAAEMPQRCTTLAHEFVHALQDQAYDLKQFHTDHDATYDADLASDSIVEGEAVLYETMIRAAFDGLTPDEVDYTERFANAATYLLNQYSSDSPYLMTPRIFPYFYGGPYVYLELQASGRPGIDSLFANPPPASLAYIVSQTSVVDTPLNPVTDAAPNPVSGTTLFAEDTLGAWLTYEYLSHASSVTQTPLQAVSGWRGDHLWIYNDGTTTNVAMIWRVRWSSPSEVSNFINVTNAAVAPSPSGTGSASRIAFSFNGDAIVVAVTGTFNLGDWQTTATIPGSGTNSTGSGADAGTAGTSQANSALVKPVPRSSSAH